ncbi:hypothetical protein [Clostridium perfringens]|uniref:hypothetical protein n=1 Tax=Clostridium perfringens TaxID=1502 RepID=UPI0039EC5BDB
MKKSKTKMIVTLLIVVGTISIAYKVYELNKNKDVASNTQSNMTLKADSNENTDGNVVNSNYDENETDLNKNNTINSNSSENEQKNSIKEEDKNVDRSNTVDANKVEDIISEKLPKGIIINLEFKNDSENPHYVATVISEDIKYEFEISLKDGNIKEIKKETLKVK